MVMVGSIGNRVKDGMAIEQAAVRGAVARLRPVLMTAATTMLGLAPLLFVSGTGSEVQRPLAVVVTGGLISATLLTLFVLPTVYRWTAREDR